MHDTQSWQLFTGQAMDTFSPTDRSIIMGRIRSKNTKPEMLVRSLLHKNGFRFSLHRKDLPGNPDIVLRKFCTVIQVRGCFWHLHHCPDGRIPKSNRGYWNKKLLRNRERDASNDEAIRALGWQLIVVWECEINTDLESTMDRIVHQLRSGQSS